MPAGGAEAAARGSQVRDREGVVVPRPGLLGGEPRPGGEDRVGHHVRAARHLPGNLAPTRLPRRPEPSEAQKVAEQVRLGDGIGDHEAGFRQALRHRVLRGIAEGRRLHELEGVAGRVPEAEPAWGEV